MAAECGLPRGVLNIVTGDGATGAALVGIELSSAGDLPGLLERMKTSECHIEMLEPGTPAYRYLT